MKHINFGELGRGKLFIVKAAFLRHIDDTPRFGPEPTFFMSLTTEDLSATVNRQYNENFKARLRELEQRRKEAEQLYKEKNKGV
jgi:hypothetical protein